jgi:transglutaminase-like putative cysteine protease
MNATTRTVLLGIVLFAIGCASSPPREAAPEVSIEEIAAAIKKHIAGKTRVDGGYYRLPYDDGELKLELVRVHMEYLADLGGGVQFACVDLADVGGDVYDVDFFLAGKPGAMTVTKRTVHKRNGQPFYAWKQREDGTWARIPVEAASPRELGVITDRDRFEFRYKVELPPITGSARVWMPLPESDAFQTVEIRSIKAPGKRRRLRDREYGNRILFLELGPQDSGNTIEVVYHVERREKAVQVGTERAAERHLKPERKVPVGGRFEKISRDVLADKQGELVRARALYDHVIDSMRYIKTGSGWGKGDAVYACDSLTGNCTDYHAYFIALARSATLPARFAIGAAIPAGRDEGGVDGYHCWAEFYAGGKWWPVDISEGDKYSRLATYYFGHHPANRFELSRGRDLVVDPLPVSGPINFLAYPVIEIDGKSARAKVRFSFTRDLTED